MQRCRCRSRRRCSGRGRGSQERKRNRSLRRSQDGITKYRHARGGRRIGSTEPATTRSSGPSQRKPRRGLRTYGLPPSLPSFLPCLSLLGSLHLQRPTFPPIRSFLVPSLSLLLLLLFLDRAWRVGRMRLLVVDGFIDGVGSDRTREGPGPRFLLQGLARDFVRKYKIE
jgi:hypothetical protein